MSATGSLSLGRIGGIPVRVHWSVGLVAVLIGLNLAAAFGTVAGLVAVVAFFASILAHELGHAFVARRHGVGTESIQLWALGGMARLDRESPTPRAEGLIAAAGPAVSLVIGAASVGAALAFESPVIAWLAGINLLLAVFNMLPGAPLDGGRVLRAWRWSRTGDRFRASREAGNAGRVLGWSIGIVGLGLTLNGYNGIFLAIVGVFIAMSARAEIMSSYFAESLSGIKVRDLTWFGVAEAGDDVDADSMIWNRSRLGEAGGVALDADGDGVLDGVVLEDSLWAIPAEQRALVMLNSLMVPFSQTAQASPDDDLSSVLPRLNPLRPIVTVWTDGKLSGMIPPARLEERLASAQQAALGR